MAVPRGALALIPARGGSKGIPGQKPATGGRRVPLVCRSIQAAQASKAVGRVLVSTDDDAIAAAAEAEGAGVIRRPAAIAGDTASSESALLHALELLEQQGPLEAELVFLQCTSPFTTGDQIDAVLSRPASTEGCNSSFAVSPWHGFLWRGRWAGHQPRPCTASPTPPGPGTGFSGNRRDLRHERCSLPALWQPLLPADEASGGGAGGAGNRHARGSGPLPQHRGPEGE